MKYTKVSTTTFQHLQLNAGVLLSEFDPATPAAPSDSTILGETSGGSNFKAEPSYIDFGEDIDNVPANTKELKRIDNIEVTLSGDFISMTPALAKRLAAAADLSGNKITPRMTLKDADFADVWLVCDYSDVNEDGTGTGANTVKAGFIAIHIINALNTNGFEIQTNNKGKGTFPFEFTGHYSIDEPETVPFEIYVSAGNGAQG